MDEKNKWLVFLIVIIVGGIFGYLLGLRRKNPELWACGGVIIGFFVDIGIWYRQRREHYKSHLREPDSNDK